MFGRGSLAMIGRGWGVRENQPRPTVKMAAKCDVSSYDLVIVYSPVKESRLCMYLIYFLFFIVWASGFILDKLLVM